MIRGLVKIAMVMVVFLGVWRGIAAVDWLNIFKVKKQVDTYETKLGDAYIKLLKLTSKESKDSLQAKVVLQIANSICDKNNLDCESLQVLVLEDEQINAFALPGERMVVNTALLVEIDDQYELAGVIAHELAHQQLNHISQKLTKELGATALISLVSGGSTGELAKAAIDAAGLGFDRGLEEEADSMAIVYLEHANVHPKSFASFLLKIKSQDEKLSKYAPYWLSTHPEISDRLDKVLKASEISKVTKNDTLVNDSLWKQMREKLQ